MPSWKKVVLIDKDATLNELTLNQVNNTTGDFITITNQGVISKRTPTQTLQDIGAQASLTNPITGTGAAGRVSFWTGTNTQSSDAGLFWNNSTKRLGIGTTSPGTSLHIDSNSFNDHISLKRLEGGFNNIWGITLSGGGNTNNLTLTAESASGYSSDTRIHFSANKTFHPQNSNEWDIGKSSNTFKNLHLGGSAYIAGNVGIGTTSPINKLHVNGNSLFTDLLFRQFTTATSATTHFRKYTDIIHYANSTSTVAGDLRIEIPVTNSTMWSMEVVIVEYDGSSVTNIKTTNLTITGYALSNSNRSVLTNNPSRISQVRWGRNLANNKSVILITPSSTFRYPKAYIKEINTHHNNETTFNDSSNYDITITTDETDFNLQGTINNDNFIRDNKIVNTFNNQTIGGVKTFSSAVVLSTAGTATTHAVRADRNIAPGSGLTGGGNLTANRSFAVDGTVIRTTGNQTIGGIKTFSSTITGSITGNAGTSTTLQTARTINGTSFNGSANITTANWGTARTLTIGNTGKSVNGSINVAWSLAEIGAAANTITLSGGDGITTTIGNLTANRSISVDSTVVRTSGNQTIGGVKTFTNNVLVNNTILSNQENLDVDTGALRVIAQISSTNHDAAFFDFVIKKGTNLRAGTVYAVHNGTIVEFTETSTNDLGNTDEVILSVDLSGGNIRLLARTDTNDWQIKTLVRGI